jgi:hypothetical protein
VDDPTGALRQVALQLAQTEHSATDALGARLSSSRQADGQARIIQARWVGGVGDAAMPDRGEPEDQADHHHGPEHEPQDVQQVTVPSPPLRTNDSAVSLARTPRP